MIKDHLSKVTCKDLQRYENIGKTGKVQKVFEVSVEHLQVFKSYTDEFSLKILAYIIKGIFLIFKRSYENLHNDLQTFIEIYVSGKRKRIHQAKNSTEKVVKPPSNKIFSIKNILTSDTNFGSFLDDNQRSLLEKTINKYDSAYSKEEKKEILSKMIEKSIAKSMKTSDKVDYPNQFDDSEGMDLNFIYSKDLFSNFINFNLDGINNNIKQEEEEKNNNIIDKQYPDLFQDFTDEKFENKTEQRNKTYDTNDIFSHINSSKFKRGNNRNIIKDRETEIEIHPSFFERSEIKKKFKELNYKMTRYHYNNLILEEEIDLFNNTITRFTGHLNVMKLENVISSLTRNFVEEENVESEELQREIPSQSERFRYDKDISTAKKRRSLDSSTILSNISLSEVFESTDKKLLNKTSYFNENLNLPDNIIIEEDSNFNLNTFSLNMKNNLNNMDLDFNMGDDFQQPQKSLDMGHVITEIEHFLNEKKLKKNSVKKMKIHLVDWASRILPYPTDYNLKEKELESIIFYRLLIAAQNEEYIIYQAGPFKHLYLS